MVFFRQALRDDARRRRFEVSERVAVDDVKFSGDRVGHVPGNPMTVGASRGNSLGDERVIDHADEGASAAEEDKECLVGG